MSFENKERLKFKGSDIRKCNVITCVHYAGGFCQESENECEFIEKAGVQEC